MNLDAFPLASLSAGTEALVRAGYGAFLTLQLLATIPSARRFFCSERHAGYVESSPVTDRWHRPSVIAAVFALWLLAALGILFGVALLPAALVNFALARYFYVHLRWKSILRGMGAPGHMNHWLGALILFLALARSLDSNLLRAMTVVTFRADFAAIMIAAGIYKIAAGYARGDGFERGLVNPWWGFYASRLRNVPARNALFAILDHAGYASEIACGAGFLIPPIAPYAAAFLGLSFLIIGLNIRLTWLAEMVAVGCAFMIPAHNPVDAALTRFAPLGPAPPAAAPAFASQIAVALAVLLGVYLAALPAAYAGMMWNFYAKRRLRPRLQRALELWTAMCGLILWRVFTADIINFFVGIEVRDGAGRVSYFSPWSARRSLRFRHVGEFICLASIFTTLKYYPHDPELFRRRLLRYANTVPVPPGASILFRYTRITKGGRRFAYREVAEFVVDTAAQTVSLLLLDPGFDPRATDERSPIVSAAKPGSYAPAVSA
jgi:hypothetical protein